MRSVTVTVQDAKMLRDLDQVSHRAWYWRDQGDHSAGFSFSEAPNEIAAQLKASERAFKTLIAAIEREGYAVHHDIAEHSYSVQRKQPE